MTDKVQKIREEIERLHEEHRGSKGDWYYRLALRSILHFIKTLQVEPAKPSVDEAMAEIERKAKLFTEANKGKTSEEILAEMRGEEPVSEDLENAALMHFKDVMEYEIKTGLKMANITSFKFGAKWQEANLWKPADGEDLPEIDREVIVLIKYGAQHNIHDKEYSTYRVEFGHRPNPDGWDGKNIATDEVTHYTPKLYDKGGWNIPDIAYWLDVELPKEIEL